ncbi:MAG TPA: hypothetical protein VKB24_04935, partial [Candidatus Acidoferrum sp.]|nr:hypothetical protein [Candidatus Acidoferrum sp.]
GPAFMTAGGVNANQRTASGTELRAGPIVFSAPEKALRRISEAVDAALPLIGNSQSDSLRAILRVPIIPELRFAFRSTGRRDKHGQI